MVCDLNSLQASWLAFFTFRGRLRYLVSGLRYVLETWDGMGCLDSDILIWVSE